MRSCCRKCTTGRLNIDAEATANAAAIAVNTNLNLLIAPDIYSDAPDITSSQDTTNLKGTSKDLDSFLHNLIHNKDEFEVEAEAVGAARIENINVNLILTVNADIL